MPSLSVWPQGVRSPLNDLHFTFCPLYWYISIFLSPLTVNRLCVTLLALRLLLLEHCPHITKLETCRKPTVERCTLYTQSHIYKDVNSSVISKPIDNVNYELSNKLLVRLLGHLLSNSVQASLPQCIYFCRLSSPPSLPIPSLSRVLPDLFYLSPSLSTPSSPFIISSPCSS